MKIKHKGIEIKYAVDGKGEPLVFLHGFLENSSMWNDILPHFNQHYRCITMDLLGHGRTASLGYIHTMEDMAVAAHAVLDTLNATNCSVIGHSMGGYVSLALLELFPEMVRNLVLLNSTSFADNEEKQLNRDRAIALVKENPNAYTNIAIANLFSEENRTKFSKEIENIREQAVRTPLQGIISALEGMKIRKDRRQLLSSFEGRKIIFSGKKDPVLSLHQHKKESKDCKIDLIAFEGGHMTYIESYAEFVSSLKAFLLSKKL